jgi:hypothetical protein
MQLICQQTKPVKSVKTGSNHPQAPQGQAIAHAAMILDNNRLRLTQAVAVELVPWLAQLFSHGSPANQRLDLIKLRRLVAKP